MDKQFDLGKLTITMEFAASRDEFRGMRPKVVTLHQSVCQRGHALEQVQEFQHNNPELAPLIAATWQEFPTAIEV